MPLTLNADGRITSPLLNVDSDGDVSGVRNIESTGLSLPVGTTAERPGSPTEGFTRYNTTTETIEFYNGVAWVSTNLIPTVDSVTGTIYKDIATSLVISITNATNDVTVRFAEGGSTIEDVEASVSSGSTTVSVPSSVYGQTAGDTITISVINQDGTPSSNNVSKTVQGIPSGGTRSIDGTTVIHSFSAGNSTLTVPTGFSASDVDVLMVAGGGGGGCGNGVGAPGEGSGGGGGGAGGLVYWGPAESAFSNQSVNLSPGTNYSISVGAGGAKAPNEGSFGDNGGNTTAFGFTALGGGGANSHESTTPSRDGGSGAGNHDRNNSSRPQGTQNSTYGYGYGNDGGLGYSSPNGDRQEAGAGGGGAGAQGGDSPGDNSPGDGGAGRDYSSIFGTSYGDSGWFAGGGGGGGGTPGVANNLGSGGQGGGGNGGGGPTSATAGQDGTGGGGGGGQGSNQGADGGDGVVLVKYTVS